MLYKNAYYTINYGTYCIKSVIDEMFDVFTHSDLSHQFVLVSVHPSQLSNVSKHILYTI